MADQNTTLPSKPFTPPPRPPQPATPAPVAPIAPPRSIVPPAGITVQETDLSHLSPSPAPHIPPSQPSPVPKPTFTPPPSPRPAMPTTPSGIPPTKPANEPSAISIPPRPTEQTVTGGMPPFRSSIRTMEQDLSKTSGRISVPPPPPRGSPVKVQSAPVNIPQQGSGGGHKMIWYIVGVLVIAMAIIAFLLFSGSSDEPTPTNTATPSQTPIPTATPAGFDEIFLNSGVLEGDLESAIHGQVLGIGETKTFMLANTALKFPADLLGALDTSKFYLSLFGKPDGSTGRGVAIRVADATKAQTAMSAWETTMARDVKDFFKLNTQRSASTNFLSNVYQNITIKYRNFPDAFNSLDYSIMVLPNGDQYLVLTNTRDHMFSIIDRVLGVVLGK